MLIASRSLKLQTKRKRRPVLVELFAPEQDSDCWECMYRITYGASKKEIKIGGVDSFQALLGAVMLIYSEITYLETYFGCRLVWNGQGDHHGFPKKIEYEERK